MILAPKVVNEEAKFSEMLRFEMRGKSLVIKTVCKGFVFVAPRCSHITVRATLTMTALLVCVRYSPPVTMGGVQQLLLADSYGPMVFCYTPFKGPVAPCLDCF